MSSHWKTSKAGESSQKIMNQSFKLFSIQMTLLGGVLLFVCLFACFSNKHSAHMFLLYFCPELLDPEILEDSYLERITQIVHRYNRNW